MDKKFISIIWGYHHQFFGFDKNQNYHMLPIEAMTEQGFTCELYAIDSQVKIENDPAFIPGTKVIYHKNFISYLCYLFRNRNYIIYSNSLTIKTLIVGLIGKKTIFYPHSYPFGHSFIKYIIIRFLYPFFTKIRVNNIDEFNLIENIKKGLGYILPLSVSDSFYSNGSHLRENGVFIGNLTQIKNPECILEAMKSITKFHPGFKLNVIGEDRYNKQGKNFRTLIAEAGLVQNIILLGFLPHDQIKKILSTSLVYINTSISEGQCLAVYEAALSGCILCLQNILAFPSVFGNNALYHSNPSELSGNICRILERKEKWSDSIKENQTLILSKYTYKNIKDGTKKMFLSLI